LAAGTYTITFDPTWGTKDVRDYTIKVYSKEKVDVKDSNGNTNYDTSIVYNNDAAVEEEDPVVDPTPVTPTPVPVTPVPVTPAPTDIYTQLQLDLVKAIAKNAASTTAFTYTNGGWYSIYKGWYDDDSYFFQFAVPVNNFNVDVSVALSSFKTVMAKNTLTPSTSQTAADGTVTISNQCLITPKSSTLWNCSYLVHAE